MAGLRRTVLLFLSVVVTVGAISGLDALIKGNVMARYSWDEMPKFWRNSNLYPLVLFGASFIITALIGLSVFQGIESAIYCIWVITYCASGIESLLYWWWLKPLKIKQPAHWKPGKPAVGWFEYPDKAPWLDPLIIPRFFSKPSAVTTRRGVYLSSLTFSALLMLSDVFLF